MWWTLTALAGPPAWSVDDGEVVQVLTDDDGQLAGVRALGRIDAPIHDVWQVLIDFDHHEDWLPMIGRTDVTAIEGSTYTVDFVVQVPGPNMRFSCDWVVDASTHSMRAVGARGSLEGGVWSWTLHDAGDHTLVERVTEASAMVDSWILRQFDDDARTLQLGINVTSPLVEVLGLRQEVLRRRATAPASTEPPAAPASPAPR